MTNTHCLKPELCGVQSHRPGTVARCASSGGRTATSSAASLSATPKLAASTETPERFVEMDTYSKEEQVELDRLLNSGESHIGGCTENELNVLKKMDDFDFMDMGIQSGQTWNFAFNDGVQRSCNVPRTSVPGIVGSLIKKEYVYSEGTGSEDIIRILPKGVAAFFELNPDRYDHVYSYGS